MKKTRWLIAFILILLPVAGRWLWYYQGTFQRETPLATPDFRALTIPEPVFSTPLPPSDPLIGGDAPLVVFDYAHSNAIYLSEMDPLLNALRAAGCEVIIDDGYGEYLSDLLKKADAYITLLPTSDFGMYTIQDIENFVNRGGRLLVAVDPTRLYGYSYNSSNEIANLLLAPYGLAFNADYAYNLVDNEANFRHLILKDFAASPLTKDLEKIVFYSAQSMGQSPTPLIIGDKNTLSSLDDKGGALPLAAASSNGRVIAIGDVTFMTVPYLQVADNQLLLRNLVTFLRSGGDERIHDLADYPYLFDHDIVIIAGEKFELDQDKLTLFSDLQNLMRGNGKSVRFGDQAVPGQDAIYFSTIPPENEEVSALASSLGITFVEDTDDTIGDGSGISTDTLDTGDGTEEIPYEITVPGIGKLSSTKFGVLIYLPGAVQNQLFILGSSEDKIMQLAKRLIGDGLTGCGFLENIAVCPVEAEEDSGDLDDWDYDYEDSYDYDYDYVEPTPSG